MNVARIAAVAVLLVNVAAAQQPQGSATVAGVVVQSNNGQPVAGAKVALFRSHLVRDLAAIAAGRGGADPFGDGRERGGDPFGGGRGRGGGLGSSPPGAASDPADDLTRYSATTAQDGRFSFDNVAPGEYRLVGMKTGGYVPGEFGQRSSTSTGVSFEVTAGEHVQGIQLVLTPTATISGRVYDRDGPVGKILVQALRPIYRDGRRTLTIVQSVQTNDKGEYRLFWLPPGGYYVATRPLNDSMVSGVRIAEPLRTGSFEMAASPVITTRLLPNGEKVEETQPPVYYPGTTDLNGAGRIDLAAGGVTDGLDISINEGPVRARHIRGAVTMNGQPAAAASILAIPRRVSPDTIAAARTNPDGSFDVAGVLPGSYLVVASSNSGMTSAVSLQMGDGDVDNLTLALVGGSRLTGRFVIDSRARAELPDITVLRATLTRDPDILGVPQTGPTFTPPPSADGSFVLEGVPVGDFRVSVRALPPNTYIRSMRLGAADVLDGGLHLTGAPREPLEIVIADAGTVSGTVMNARQEPVTNSRVVLVPEPSLRHRADLYKTSATDRTGRFRIAGIAAGTYIAVAWEDVEEGAWQDPDFMRAFDNRGSTVRVREGTEETIQLQVIPLSGR